MVIAAVLRQVSAIVPLLQGEGTGSRSRIIHSYERFNTLTRIRKTPTKARGKGSFPNGWLAEASPGRLGSVRTRGNREETGRQQRLEPERRPRGGGRAWDGAGGQQLFGKVGSDNGRCGCWLGEFEPRVRAAGTRGRPWVLGAAAVDESGRVWGKGSGWEEHGCWSQLEVGLGAHRRVCPGAVAWDGKDTPPRPCSALSTTLAPTAVPCVGNTDAGRLVCEAWATGRGSQQAIWSSGAVRTLTDPGRFPCLQVRHVSSPQRSALHHPDSPESLLWSFLSFEREKVLVLSWWRGRAASRVWSPVLPGDGQSEQNRVKRGNRGLDLLIFRPLLALSFLNFCRGARCCHSVLRAASSRKTALTVHSHRVPLGDLLPGTVAHRQICPCFEGTCLVHILRKASRRQDRSFY